MSSISYSDVFSLLFSQNFFNFFFVSIVLGSLLLSLNLVTLHNLNNGYRFFSLKAFRLNFSIKSMWSVSKSAPGLIVGLQFKQHENQLLETRIYLISLCFFVINSVTQTMYKVSSVGLFLRSSAVYHHSR